MSGNLLTALIYFITGFAAIYLFQDRRKRVTSLAKEHFPQLNEDEFLHLKKLLKTAYERILYLAIPLLMLGVTNLRASTKEAKLFFLVLLILLFFYNIPPRNKIMQFFEEKGIDYRELKAKGFKL